MLGKKYIEIQGAKQNNLQNINIKIPRNKITVITGVSGSGKSSLAFDIIYGEGQRRFMDAMPTYARNRIRQEKKADVDFVFGLSPVIAIDQKNSLINPRSTVGTMTDIYDYLRLLYASVGKGNCPICGHTFDLTDTSQIMEAIMALPEGTKIQVSSPLEKIYGESYAYLFDQVRQKGYQNITINGHLVAISDAPEIDDDQDHEMSVIIGTFEVAKDLEKSISNAINKGLEIVANHVVTIDILSDHLDPRIKEDFYDKLGCHNHHLAMANIESHYFSFNNIASACHTCHGIGTSKKAEPKLMVPHPHKSLSKGAIDPSVYNSKNDTNGMSVLLYNLSKQYDFSLDIPFEQLSEETKDLLFNGTRGKNIEIKTLPPGLDHHWMMGRKVQFSGFVNQVNWWYRGSIRKDEVNESVLKWFKEKMVEYTCPDCQGRKLKKQRFDITLQGKNIHDLSWMDLETLHNFLNKIQFPGDKVHVAGPIIDEILKRLNLLIETGLHYLSLGRRADTISGGEGQRIKLASQISSGLMGMIYVLDEPSIGLHPRDGARIIAILKKLRDLGNTVIVVEHDLATIVQADHMIELGPGPGIHGGKLVDQGRVKKIMEKDTTLTSRYLSGSESIPLPNLRRPSNGHYLTIYGARENNLKNITVKIPLGLLACISGVSGSGKSTLVHEIVYKQLRALSDPRILPGKHDRLEGHENINHVVHIDQSPIGKSSRSNPATYIGLFDSIRKLFTQTSAAKEKGYTITHFSFNSKSNGRCEHCKGEGRIVTKLNFMPDIEIVCPICKGKQYRPEILDITYQGKNIHQVLDMSIEEAESFFKNKKYLHHKLAILNQLGLGYLKLGQASNTLSGGEAQRIKLAAELGKIKHGKGNLYILDEPTTGLHTDDIKKLMTCLQLFVAAGHSLLVIEHNLEVLKCADHIIDLGPSGGHKGGYLVAEGTPEAISQNKASITGQFLRPLLNKNPTLTSKKNPDHSKADGFNL